jgi:steroid delta-isomerase-like uncharacterized protein
MVTPTTTHDEVERSARALSEYLEKHDPTYLTDDATFTDVTSGMTWTGRDAISGMLGWMYHGVFDAHVEDVRLIIGADGRSAVAEMTFVGRHIAEFAGVPATDRDVRVPLVVVYDLRDGQISGARVHWNVASFQAQAGMR